MDVSFDRINKVFKFGVISLVIILNILVYFLEVNLLISIVILIFSFFIVGGFFLYEELYKRHMKSNFEQLSNMLTAIIDMREEEVFSTVEDTILGKLQFQTNKLTNILKNQNKRIESEKNEIKSLISDIAHQLKTPLTNLRMYGEFLQDENLSEDERKEFNEIILLSLNRLSFLIENMIKMSRLESGVIQLKPELAPLNETLFNALKNVQKKAKNKNINIEVQKVEQVNIIHDKKWTSEAIFNVIENAVKYTKSNGMIKIKITNYEIFLRVDIEDNGMGISEEELPKIFTRFYRGQNVTEEEGLGIGLYLTREIISRQGGYIKVSSNEKGTIFSLFFKKDI
ncbi:sensor histidine kinase [Clostridium massiliamazoniense]|uniref:sensor histidine kinase n=1 Tax=Clostridium massiliamazoniense TaxID=1347366 RepID=UPI0006D7ED72|nr:HAMP domain-containing sensor histidine kinase [Clostridium massiliamazoniense]